GLSFADFFRVFLGNRASFHFRLFLFNASSSFLRFPDPIAVSCLWSIKSRDSVNFSVGGICGSLPNLSPRRAVVQDPFETWPLGASFRSFIRKQLLRSATFG